MGAVHHAGEQGFPFGIKGYIAVLLRSGLHDFLSTLVHIRRDDLQFGEARNNSRAIFHNINSKQIPLKLEQNIKIIIESSSVFTDSILEKSQPFGSSCMFTRELLCGNDKIDFGCFPHIKNFVYENKYSFFTDLFRHLLKEGLINEATAVDDVKRELVNVENAIGEASITASSDNYSIVGALAYYRLLDLDKYNRIYFDNEHLAPLVREISWTNNLIIMSRAKTAEAREFYLMLAVRN